MYDPKQQMVTALSMD